MERFAVNAYDNALRLISPNIHVYSEACPLLAPFVEKGLFGADRAIRGRRSNR